jgi:hypothetical protein
MKLRNATYILSVCSLLICISAVHAGQVPDTGQASDFTCNPHSYTDLGNGVVQDTVTGLLWQKATAPGMRSGKYDWKEAVAYCDNLTLGGYTDWRLPTIKELSMLVDSGVTISGQNNPIIDVTYFPETAADKYWTSSLFAGDSGQAWNVEFSYGVVDYDSIETNSFFVRAVRGEQYVNKFIDNADGTITDSASGLVWEKSTGASAVTLAKAKSYCEKLSLGGKNDWRLPTRNEMQSIVDYTRFNPAIDTAYFPDTVSSEYWTSTKVASDYAGGDLWWFVGFRDGDISSFSSVDELSVRAVRAGQCGPTDNCTDADGDGYFAGKGCTPFDCDDTDWKTHEGCKEAPCSLEIFPGRISSAAIFFLKIIPFIITADKESGIDFGVCSVAFKSDYIRSLVSIKLSSRIIIGLFAFNPFKVEKGDTQVNVIIYGSSPDIRCADFTVN